MNEKSDWYLCEAGNSPANTVSHDGNLLAQGGGRCGLAVRAGQQRHVCRLVRQPGQQRREAVQLGQEESRAGFLELSLDGLQWTRRDCHTTRGVLG